MDFLKVDQYIEDHLEENLVELSKLIAVPSISAERRQLKECADLLISFLERRRFSIQRFSNHDAPIIVAEKRGRTSDTLLFYNHYDVQPPEPLEEWKTPPFEAVIKNELLYGRGSNDNKGNITNRLLAIDALLNESEELPCTIKFLIEGEEETSSQHFEHFVRSHQDLLMADACIWEFGGVDHEDTPMQYLGLRGICYVELEVQTAQRDIHSGLGGSIFPNAAWRLVWALASLKSDNEKILIEGFYDDIVPPQKRDIELMSALPETSDDYKKRFGIDQFLGGLTGGAELRIAEAFRPTCTICGLTAGYQGSGSKTVMPARASAKLDFRLVPNQRPEVVLELLKNHLKKSGYGDVKVNYLGGEAPARTDPDDPFVKLVVDTAKDIYDKPMRIVPMTGGSGPNSVVQDVLKIPIVTIGIGHPDGRAHAPNENIRLDLYKQTAKYITRIINQFSSR
jgi:acetylornithine deacetylase/succinyl-diaminopimelate desuccinylase-like protein